MHILFLLFKLKQTRLSQQSTTRYQPNTRIDSALSDFSARPTSSVTAHADDSAVQIHGGTTVTIRFGQNGDGPRVRKAQAGLLQVNKRAVRCMRGTWYTRPAGFV